MFSIREPNISQTYTLALRNRLTTQDRYITVRFFVQGPSLSLPSLLPVIPVEDVAYIPFDPNPHSLSTPHEPPAHVETWER
jgi:hypothetical protein